MEIYLTPPGGQPQGPYTLEEINRNLAAKKYSDTDYWAWYSGQTEWVPLHQVPGVIGSDNTAAWVLEPTAQAEAAGVEPEPIATAAPQQPPALAVVDTPEPKALAGAPPEPDGAPMALDRELSSGLPFAALDEVFVLTTGDGPAASRSSVTARILEQTVGEPLATIREQVARNVLARCSFMEQLRTQGTLPPEAWGAMSHFKPQLVQDARAGRFKICVRTFPIDTNDVVCLFLFYNKQKL